MEKVGSVSALMKLNWVGHKNIIPTITGGGPEFKPQYHQTWVTEWIKFTQKSSFKNKQNITNATKTHALKKKGMDFIEGDIFVWCVVLGTEPRSQMLGWCFTQAAP
jgi:hypothetical protein